MKLFALVIGDRSRASSRLRVWDHLEWMKSSGYSVSVDYAVPSDACCSQVYKLWYTIIRIPKWINSILKADYVIVQEVLLIWPFFPLITFVTRAKVLFDFSDPIETVGTGMLNRFRRIGLRVITKYCGHVCVENKVYVRELENKGISVSCFYGPIDVERYDAAKKSINRSVNKSTTFRIGWTGSPGTFHYIEPLLTCLDSLATRYDIELILIGVTAISHSIKNLKVTLKPWCEETEFNLVPTFDLGLFVLNDDEKSKRRGAGKIFIYLAAGVPFAASNIGIARDIMDEVMVGYRVNDKSEWEATIEHAIRSRGYGQEIGKVSQKFARDNLSYEKYRLHIRGIFESIIK